LDEISVEEKEEDQSLLKTTLLFLTAEAEHVTDSIFATVGYWAVKIFMR